MVFIVITSTSIPDHLRGYLTRFLNEVNTGVFVGNVSHRVRNNLWQRCGQALQTGTMTMINQDSSREQGFAVNTLGPERRIISDMDGFLIASTLSPLTPKNGRL